MHIHIVNKSKKNYSYSKIQEKFNILVNKYGGIQAALKKLKEDPWIDLRMKESKDTVQEQKGRDED